MNHYFPRGIGFTPSVRLGKAQTAAPVNARDPEAEEEDEQEAGDNPDDKDWEPDLGIQATRELAALHQEADHEEIRIPMAQGKVPCRRRDGHCQVETRRSLV